MKSLLIFSILFLGFSVNAQKSATTNWERYYSCYNTIIKNRKIKSQDGFYLADGKINNIFEQLEVELDKINSNSLASEETKTAVKNMKASFSSYYQCDSAGNPVPINNRNTLNETLIKYDHFCQIAKDGVKIFSLESFTGFLKDLSGLKVIPLAWVYNRYFDLSNSFFNNSAKTTKVDRFSMNVLESVIIQKGIPKSNISDDVKDQLRNTCPDSYLDYQIPKIESRGPVESTQRPASPTPIQRRRPGTR